MPTCSRCGRPTRSVAVPDSYRGLLPEDPPAIAVCERCLGIEPADAGADHDAASDHDAGSGDDGNTLESLSDALPADPAARVGVIILIALCESIAHNRAAITDTIGRLERDGVDPLLAVDRIRTDDTVDPAVDLATRRHQLEQILS